MAESTPERQDWVGGDRVLHLHDLLEAWTVIGHKPDRLLTARIGNCEMTGPEENSVLAPASWEDAPVRPMGSVSLGLDSAAWNDKYNRDEADEAHQAALAQWRVAFMRWDRRHRQPLLGRDQPISRAYWTCRLPRIPPYRQLMGTRMTLDQFLNGIRVLWNIGADEYLEKTTARA